MQNVVSDSFDVTTLLGSKLGLSLLLPLDMETQSQYTLNHLFNVFSNEQLNGETPKLKYFGVGIRGRQRSASSWGGCGHRGDAHLHVHPRRAEGECHHHHIGVLRSLPQLGADKERIPEPDQVI